MKLIMFLYIILISLLQSPALAESKAKTILTVPSPEKCQIFYASKSDIENLKTSPHHELTTLGHVINNTLKTSYEFANKLDHYTFGLVSAFLFNGNTQTLEQMAPENWNKFTLSGRLLYLDSPLSPAPLRGTKMTISDTKKSVEILTGTEGEFTEYFYKIIPYKRFRLFPFPILELGNKHVVTAKIPLNISIDSKICKGSVTLTKIPFEPILLIASPTP